LSSLTQNQTGTFLAFIGFVLLALFVLLTRLRFAFSDGGSASFSISTSLHSGENPSAVKINCDAWGLPFFLRAHLRISGKLASGSLPAFHIAREYRFSGKGEFDAELFLPAGGELSVRGVFSVRDVLGFTRRVIGSDLVCTRPVWSTSVADLDIDVRHDSVSQDPKALSRQADLERVFVREYASGDLARDINWKALARIGSLLTRIPPEAPRESKLVRLVALMPIEGSSSRERGQALVQIEHIRVLVSSFLETFRRTAPDYSFTVCLGSAEFTIEPGERFDGFYSKLSCAGFGSRNPENGIGSIAASEKAWIIGSASDPSLTGMADELLAKGNRLILSRMIPARAEKRAGDAYRVSLFSALPGAFPSRFLLTALAPVSVPSRAQDSIVEFECGVNL
jgi:hypothetical protein